MVLKIDEEFKEKINHKGFWLISKTRGPKNE